MKVTLSAVPPYFGGTESAEGIPSGEGGDEPRHSNAVFDFALRLRRIVALRLTRGSCHFPKYPHLLLGAVNDLAMTVSLVHHTKKKTRGVSPAFSRSLQASMFPLHPCAGKISKHQTIDKLQQFSHRRCFVEEEIVFRVEVENI